MTPEELDREIVAFLSTRYGQAQAIGARAIAVRLGRKPSAERIIRRRIAAIFEADNPPFLLGASSGGGYWRIIDADEALQTHAWYARLARRTQARARAFAHQCQSAGIHLDYAEESDRALIQSAIQAQGKQSIRAFSKSIGIAPSTWSQIRSGNYPGRSPQRVIKKIRHYLNHQSERTSA